MVPVLPSFPTALTFVGSPLGSVPAYKTTIFLPVFKFFDSAPGPDRFVVFLAGVQVVAAERSSPFVPLSPDSALTVP